MGTINYGTSKYITMGFEAMTAWDIEQDEQLFEALKQEAEEYCGEVGEYIESYVQQCNDSDYDNIDYLLNERNFVYFNITLNTGYYDGCYLDIDYGRDILDNEDRRIALEEVEEVREFLKDCNGEGMKACYPSWGTRFDNYEATDKNIDKACEEMRRDIEAVEVEDEQGA